MRESERQVSKQSRDKAKARYDKIKEALAKKPTILPNVKTDKLNNRIVEKNKRTRPPKGQRSAQVVNPKLLLNTPNFSGKFCIEYPTPIWFKSVDKVDVSIIVPLYKSEEVVKGLIQSWNIINDGLNVEIIFVDDQCPRNSKDTVVKQWTLRKKELEESNIKHVGKILYNTVNVGFGMTCNAGADVATGDYLIFLNADTLVTKNWIKPIIDLLKDKEVGIVGNLQIKKGGPWDGTIDSAGSEWSWTGMSFLHIGRHTYNYKGLTQPFNLNVAPKSLFKVAEREMVTGCCIGIRRELFKTIGGFNPNYRIGYWEDSDLCLTVREKGYKIMFQPDSKIYHLLGHTQSGAHKFQDYNRNFFFNKWVNTGRIDSLIVAKRENAPKINTILLNRRESNGDVLLAAALAPALKKKYPNCSIYFSTKCKEVLEGNPFIDRIIEDKDVTERLFQVYYNLDMTYENRPFSHMLEAYADTVGVKMEDCQLFLKTTKVKHLPEKYVVVHAGSTGWTGRNWKPDRFDDIAHKLKSEGHFVVCVGRGDHLVPCDLDLRNKTTIAELSHVIKNTYLFVGIDSFPMHVAQTFNIPSICFFGSIDPKLRLTSKNITAITASNLECLGCHHRKPAPSVVTNTCETVTLDCIDKVTVEMMWKAIKDKLNVNNIHNMSIISD
jgi:GT2 family glycosyltransferase